VKLRDYPPEATGQRTQSIVNRLDSSLITIEYVIPLLGRVAGAFGSGDFRTGISSALDAICDALDADNAEIFFSEPEGDDLVLTAFRGVDEEELSERTRFAPGVGFPGLVGEAGVPLVSENLSADARYLRKSVVEKGINAYACVPMRAPHSLKGTLNVMWRVPPANMDLQVAILGQVASLLSTYIAAQLSQLRSLVDQAMQSVADRTLDEQLRVLLALVVRVADAPKAAAKVSTAPDQNLTVVHGFREQAQIEAASKPCACPCDVVLGGHGGLIEGGEVCHDGQMLIDGMAHPCRLAMNYGGRPVGCVLVDLGPDLPRPVTGQLLPLLVITQQAALHIRGTLGRVAQAQREIPESVPEFELRCFGSFEVSRKGAPIKSEAFTRKPSLEILKILALSPGHSRTGEQLIEALWPEVDQEAGKNRLHVALHGLRTALEPDGQRGDWRAVLSHQGAFSLPRDTVWVDVDEFEELWKRVRTLRSANESGRVWLPFLERLLDLYRGDLFAESPYSEWCAAQRTHFRHIFVEATSLLVDLLMEAGEFDRAIERLLRALKIDEFEDTLNRRLVEIRLAQGRRDLAEVHYEGYLRRLHEELDCAPLPETLRLGELLAQAKDDFQLARRRLKSKLPE